MAGWDLETFDLTDMETTKRSWQGQPEISRERVPFAFSAPCFGLLTYGPEVRECQLLRGLVCQARFLITVLGF
jgi:hypothetical protein